MSDNGFDTVLGRLSMYVNFLRETMPTQNLSGFDSLLKDLNAEHEREVQLLKEAVDALQHEIASLRKANSDVAPPSLPAHPQSGLRDEAGHETTAERSAEKKASDRSIVDKSIYNALDLPHEAIIKCELEQARAHLDHRNTVQADSEPSCRSRFRADFDPKPPEPKASAPTTPRMHQPPDGCINVLLRLPSGESCHASARLVDTVVGFREVAEQALGLRYETRQPRFLHSLVFDGVILKDMDSLQDYGISDGAEISVVLSQFVPVVGRYGLMKIFRKRLVEPISAYAEFRADGSAWLLDGDRWVECEYDLTEAPCAAEDEVAQSVILKVKGAEDDRDPFPTRTHFEEWIDRRLQGFSDAATLTAGLAFRVIIKVVSVPVVGLPNRGAFDGQRATVRRLELPSWCLPRASTDHKKSYRFGIKNVPGVEFYDFTFLRKCVGSDW